MTLSNSQGIVGKNVEILSIGWRSIGQNSQKSKQNSMRSPGRPAKHWW